MVVYLTDCYLIFYFTNSVVDVIQRRFVSPFLAIGPLFNLSSVKVKQDKALHVLHSFTRNIIEERFVENSNQKFREAASERRKLAFLDVLMNAETEGGQKLSKSDIQEEVDTFMSAGHDTTGLGLTWAVYLLGRYKDVQTKVKDEIDQVLGDEPITREKLRKLVYMEQVIKEVFRMYGPTPFLGRILSQECEAGGYTLPKGIDIIIDIYSIHRNPDVWENPNEFNPDRFSKENSISRHPYAHIPFSAGPRNCLGQKFAMQEEKILLSLLLKEFNFTSHDKESDLKVKGQITLRSISPLNITLERRNNHVSSTT